MITRRIGAALRSLPATSWVVLGSTHLTALLVALDAPAPLRVPAVLVWTLLVPGLPWARLLGLGDRADVLTVAVALSLAAAAVVGGLLALAGAWDAAAAFRLLAAVAVVGVVLPAVHAAARTGPDPALPTDARGPAR